MAHFLFKANCNFQIISTAKLQYCTTLQALHDQYFVANLIGIDLQASPWLTLQSGNSWSCQLFVESILLKFHEDKRASILTKKLNKNNIKRKTALTVF